MPHRLIVGTASVLIAGLISVTTASAAEAPGVVVAEATELSFPLIVEALGSARANESVEVRPKVTEVLTEIAFREGESVQAGDVLVRLQDTQALASVAEARAALVDSQSQYRRARELFETQAVSASQLEQLAAQRDADRAALDAAEARLSDTVVRAPFEGRVGLRRVSLGSLVTPQTVITTLDDTDPVKVDFDVPETAIARLAEGLSLKAHSAAYPDRDFTGEVLSVDTRVDPVSRSVTVRGLIPNPDGELRPGMFLSVELLKQDVTALLVPEGALSPEGSRQYVFVVGEGDIIERRLVTTARRRPGQVEVTGGLSAGERVVVEGAQKVREGEPVRVVRRLAMEVPDS